MTDFSDFLLVSDYDRTLTAPDSTIPAANIEAIRRFIAQGGKFTLGTGRSIPMAQPFLTGFPFNAPLILYNGAAAYDVRTGELSGAVWMPTGRELLVWLTEQFPELWLEIQGVDAHYLVRENPAREAFYRRMGVAHKTVSVEEAPARYFKLALFGDFTDSGVNQFFTGTPAEDARFAECQARIMEAWPELVADRAAVKIIDLQNRQAGKGAAARALARRLGRHTLVCVGDAMNDASMLREADLAFAPADCAEAVKALGAARLVCPCGEGAIAGVVEALAAL